MISGTDGAAGEEKKRGPGRPKKKQEDLPEIKGAGVAKPCIEEIDTAAAEYVKQRDKRVELTAKEVDAKKTLMDLMHKHKLKVYDYEDMVVELVPKDQTETLKVKKRAEYEAEE